MTTQMSKYSQTKVAAKVMMGGQTGHLVLDAPKGTCF